MRTRKENLERPASQKAFKRKNESSSHSDCSISSSPKKQKCSMDEYDQSSNHSCSSSSYLRETQDCDMDENYQSSNHSCSSSSNLHETQDETEEPTKRQSISTETFRQVPTRRPIGDYPDGWLHAQRTNATNTFLRTVEQPSEVRKGIYPSLAEFQKSRHVSVASVLTQTDGEGIQRKLFIYLCLLLLFSLGYMLCAYQMSGSASSANRITDYVSLNQLDQMPTLYPHQQPFTWVVLRSAFKSALRRKESNRPLHPTVLLLASTEAGDSTTRCFVHSIDEIIFRRRSELFESRATCYTVTLFNEWANYESVDGVGDLAKLALDKKISKAYSQNSKCFILPHIERYSKDVLRFVHGLTDPETSPYLDAFFFIHYHASDKSADETYKWNSASQVELERSIRKSIKSTFLENKYLEDEVDALIGRIANNILYIQPERDVEIACPID